MCIICSLKRTIIDTQNISSKAIKPNHVYAKLPQFFRDFTFGTQQDSHEFLIKMLEEVNKVYSDLGTTDAHLRVSPIDRLIGVKQTIIVECSQCHTKTEKIEWFRDLQISIENGKIKSLSNGLTEYFGSESVNDYECSSQICNGQKVLVTKKAILSDAPVSLCILLKRFENNGSKLSKTIEVEEYLDLTEYILSNPSNESFKYRISSVIEHSGISIDKGHYVTICTPQPNEWWKFDDERVS